MRILDTRIQLQKCNKKLKRARHLYVLFCKKTIEQEGTFALKRAAEYAIAKFLWKHACLKDAEFSILRIMCKIDKYCVREFLTTTKPGWHQWLEDKGWNSSRSNWFKSAA